MERLRVLVADDEPKIRRGLVNSVNGAGLDMEVVAEAEDGAIALEKAIALEPDLMLVDICMPFLSGLDLIERLRDALPDCLVIVVTGHDEFSYAQQSVRLNVFDYILKPILREQLREALSRAAEALAAERVERDYLHWAKWQLEKNMPYIRERFLNDWVEGRLHDAEIEQQLSFFGCEFPVDAGMMLIKVGQMPIEERERQLQMIALKNVVEDLLAPHRPLIFRDGKDLIVAILSRPPLSAWEELGDKCAAAVKKYLSQSAWVLQTAIEGGRGGVLGAYRTLNLEIAREENWTPVVKLCKAYIDSHYAEDTLSLTDVAAELSVSPAYLSRLMRQEMGDSFIDYLIRVRMNKAAALLKDPLAKIGDVAREVGYGNQHYFSASFKKKMGVSPAEYRKEAGK